MVIVVSYCRGGSSYDSHINVLTNDSILTRVGLFINYEIYKYSNHSVALIIF